uniref:NopRA1 domain-containing protein n=1 Tax=Heligmosomoides polygyrus TaxID=6339 RepID=A0A183GDJ7_HELPZ
LSCLSKSPIPFGASSKARPSRTDELENAFKGIVPSARESVLKAVDFHFLTHLLVSYNATTSEEDRRLYEALELLENTYKVNMGYWHSMLVVSTLFRVVCPIVWGPTSVEIYKKRAQYGTSLHRTAPDQVLELLDGIRMWQTVLDHSRPPLEGKDARTLYAVRFLLRLFLSMMHAGSEQNCLALTFSCTSSRDASVRKLAYCVLQRFLSLLQVPLVVLFLPDTSCSASSSILLQELDIESADDRYRNLYVYLLRFFKQSIEQDAPRLPHMVSHFFARVSKLILHPESPVYTAVLSFLVLKPIIDLNNVPELYKMLLSSSTEHHNEEREWILKLVYEGLIEPMDYNVLQNRSVVFCFTVSKPHLIFFVQLRSEADPVIVSDVHDQHEHQTTDPFDSEGGRANAIRGPRPLLPNESAYMDSDRHRREWCAAKRFSNSQFSSAFQNRGLSWWEQCYLGQIYSILIESERKYCRRSGGGDSKVSYVVALASVRLTARQVVAAMNDIGAKPTAMENLHSIEETLNAKWRPKKKKKSS